MASIAITTVVEEVASWAAANAGTIAAVTTAAAGAYAGVEARQQGIAADKMDRQRARVEAMNETQKQITMRQNMLRALASQNAAGAGNVGGRNSSFGANAMRQITESQNDLMVSKSNSSAQVSLLDQAGKNASAAGSANAVGEIVGGISKIGLGAGS